MGSKLDALSEDIARRLCAELKIFRPFNRVGNKADAPPPMHWNDLVAFVALAVSKSPHNPFDQYGN
jgi:hypothetical protein